MNTNELTELDYDKAMQRIEEIAEYRRRNPEQTTDIVKEATTCYYCNDFVAAMTEKEASGRFIICHKCAVDLDEEFDNDVHVEAEAL